MSIDEHKKSRGRPSVDTEMLRSRVDRSVVDAIERWITAQPDPKPSRPEAIRFFLRDSLTRLGFLPHGKNLKGVDWRE